MKTIISITVLVLITAKMECQSQSFLFIEMQEGFNRDTVSVFVNNELIIDNVILTSSKVGKANCYIYMVKYQQNLYLLNKLENHKYLIPTERKIESSKEGHFNIRCVINEINYNKSININKGRFIGISNYNWESDTPSFRQKDKPFEYD